MAWWAAAAGGALGKVLGKIVDYIPGREESLRNQKQKLERERDELLNKPSLSPRDSAHLGTILVKLHQVESKLANR